MKLKKIWLYDEVFKQNYLFLIGDRITAEKFLNKNYSESFNVKESNDAKIFRLETGGIIMWIPRVNNKPRTLAVLSHELAHAVSYCFDFHGIKLDPQNDEPFSYYLEYLTRKFLEGWNKK
jgi:hypothetical protein